MAMENGTMLTLSANVPNTNLVSLLSSEDYPSALVYLASESAAVARVKFEFFEILSLFGLFFNISDTYPKTLLP